MDRWPVCDNQAPRNRSDGATRIPGRQPVRTSLRDHGSPLLAMPPKSMTTKHIFVTGGVASSLG
ncbi:hypothetical protein, partial [Streptomyces sp. NPDC055287]